MEKYYYSKVDLATLCQRPAIRQVNVSAIMEAVRKGGDEAVRGLTKRYDLTEIKDLQVTRRPKISAKLLKALETAASNIEKFHKAQIRQRLTVGTMPGVTCFRESRPIERVGLYIPGGTAPLPSTVLMLGIPAKLAGCKEIVLVTPPAVDDSILAAAEIVGLKQIFQIGGAQAIAALAYGTESVPKVDKICGPGNQYVTAAKMQAQSEGCAIDMPAGPSEVMVIADEQARPDFVAADLLSQAEHGPDSQVVLVCSNPDPILQELEKQLKLLPRQEIAKQALEKSFTLITENLDQAIAFANQYAPEHLILNTANADQLVPQIINAGSVFLGPYSCESAGDYASGTNHTLPTYGYAKAYSGVSIDTFTKQITFQKITRQGAKNIGPTVATIAQAENLIAHKRAMTIRYE